MWDRWGTLCLRGGCPNIAAVERIAATMGDRRPDAAGIWSHKQIALAHRRLKIIDLTETGAQPMVDAALGITVVFNGCIYNYKELRAELQAAGYRFFSTTHTEVIGKAYKAWGDNFVDRLIGMFAICVYEQDTGRTVLLRDRLGIKPMYLSDRPGRMRFASTLPGLLAGGELAGHPGGRAGSDGPSGRRSGVLHHRGKRATRPGQPRTTANCSQVH